MIKINIDDKSIENAKNVFRKWFFSRKNNIQEFKSIIEKDSKLRTIIFGNKEIYDRWIKTLCQKPSLDERRECQEILENFFFADFNDKKNKSRYIVDGVILRDETKKFFKDKYKNFRDTQGAKLVRELDIKVCPYCNRNYIELYNYKDKRGRTKRVFKGELDHYYSQSRYPHLSLCLFNLIPCCKVCNHEKLDEDLIIFHPYYDNEDSIYKFTLSPLIKDDIYDITFEEKIDSLESKINDITYLQGISDNFKIIIEPIDDKNRDKIDNSNHVFKLEKKYNSSKSYVKELLRKRFIYSDSYADMLSENFNSIFNSPKDVKRDIFCNELNGREHNGRPLSKLTYDILKEFEII